MPYGFFTVEQWKARRGRAPEKWVAILHLDAYRSPSKAMEFLQERSKPGLYRVVQTQRCVWAQMEDGKVRLHGSHVGSTKSLAELAKIFEREGGRRPVEKAREARRREKARRGAR
jgi:hypothetical protein